VGGRRRTFTIIVYLSVSGWKIRETRVKIGGTQPSACRVIHDQVLVRTVLKR
jgi:hypothetical protein